MNNSIFLLICLIFDFVGIVIVVIFVCLYGSFTLAQNTF